MRDPRSTITLTLAILFAATGLAETTLATATNVDVWAVRATKRNRDVSPELKSLANALKKQFRYTGFKLEKKASGKVETNKRYSTSLIRGYSVVVKPLERTSSRVKLEVTVSKRDSKGKSKTVLKTTVTTKLGAFVPVGCGSLDKGDYMILLVRGK